MSRCAEGHAPRAVSVYATMLLVGALFCSGAHGRTVGVGLSGWRDWPLDEGVRPASSASGDGESTLLVRRITPKSVFVAPGFGGCVDGYRQDGTGRCVKPVKVNQAAQLDFILHKLNSKFANNRNTSEKKGDAGPFRVDLPLAFVTNDQRTTTSTETVTDSPSTSYPGDPTTTPLPLLTENLPQRPESAVKRQPLIIVVADTTGQPTDATTEVTTTLESTTTTEVYTSTLDTDVPSAPESPSPSLSETTTELTINDQEYNTPTLETATTVTTSGVLLENTTPTPDLELDLEPGEDVDKARPVSGGEEGPDGPSSDKEVLVFTEQDALKSGDTLPPATQHYADCEEESGYSARVVNSAPCRTIQVTTTSTPNYVPVRFPGSDAHPQPSPYSYSDSNTFIRFPDRVSTTFHQHFPYATKVWSDSLSMSPSTSSGTWFSPPSASSSSPSFSWFPFLQPHKSRPNRYNSHSYFHYENGDRRPLPSPSSLSLHMFRRPATPSLSPSSSSWPNDKRISWPYTTR